MPSMVFLPPEGELLPDALILAHSVQGGVPLVMSLFGPYQGQPQRVSEHSNRDLLANYQAVGIQIGEAGLREGAAASDQYAVRNNKAILLAGNSLADPDVLARDELDARPNRTAVQFFPDPSQLPTAEGFFVLEPVVTVSSVFFNEEASRRISIFAPCLSPEPAPSVDRCRVRETPPIPGS